MNNFQATLEDKLELNDFFTQYSFELKQPHRLSFEAGQAVKIKINRAVEKEYFIASSPAVDHGFEIIVDQRTAGPGAEFLKNLPFGQVVDFTGPEGEFVIDQTRQTELILIGTGVGVAPLYSMVQDLLQNHHSQRKTTLYWGLENTEELFMSESFEDLVEAFPNFYFHPVLAQALPEWSLCRGTVFDCLSIHKINADADFYISTDRQLGEKLKNLCLTNSVKEGQLHLTFFRESP